MQIRGNFDGVNGTVAAGWAQNSAAPEKRLVVELFDGKKILARQEASTFRGDLKAANIGDGAHAFEFPLPAEIFDGQVHRLTVVAEGKHRLAPADVEFCASVPLGGQTVELDGAALAVRLHGSIRHASVFEVWDNGRLAAQLQRQPDAAGLVVLPLPESSLDGMPHLFSVRVPDRGALIGELAAITPCLHAPDDVVRRLSGPQVKAGLSSMSALRYESLRSGLARCLDRKLDGADLAAELASLLQVHEQVVRGFAATDTVFAPLTFPAHEAPDVSIVMPVHNKFEVTYNGLASLLLADNKASFELILVDDGSTDETCAAPGLISGIRYVRHEDAQGFVRSCNHGASLARGRYVVMLNNDVEVTNRWLDELIWPFEQFERVGLVGSKLLYPNGRLQEAGGIVWGSGAAWNYGRNGNPFEPRFNYTRQVDYISGASIMLPRALWNELGGFDEAFVPAYYEDTDLAFRVRRAGYKTLYAPLSRVVHFEGVSSGTSVESGIKKYQKINQPKFRARWAANYRNNGIEASDPDLVKDRNVALRALLLDSQTPTPDKDAGSYAAVQEMRLLQSLGFKISFASESLVFQGQYTEALQRMGVECLYAPYYLSLPQILERRGGEFDLVYITRYSVASNIIDAVRRWAPRAKIILNNADLHFLREMRLAIAKGDREQLRASLDTRSAELAVMNKVDLVLSYNEVEHAVIMSHNLDTTQVAKCPWVVDAPEHVPAFGPRKDVAFLGGFGHSPNVEAVEYFVGKVMPLLRKRLPGVNFLVYGSNVPESVRELAAADVIIKGYVHDVAQVYDTCRVFVAPLLSGAGIKGKVIGALAHGVPCVLSPVAAEGTEIRSGLEAFVASDPAAWADQIAKLHENEPVWSSMSEAARRFARERFSFEQGKNLMRLAVEGVGIYCDPEETALYQRAAAAS